MWVAIVRTAKQNCLECALEAGLEENKVSGHKTVSGLRCSKLMSLGFVGVFLGVVLNLAGRARSGAEKRLEEPVLVDQSYVCT